MILQIKMFVVMSESGVAIFTCNLSPGTLKMFNLNFALMYDIQLYGMFSHLTKIGLLVLSKLLLGTLL
jgi:hypothetical protein